MTRRGPRAGEGTGEPLSPTDGVRISILRCDSFFAFSPSSSPPFGPPAACLAASQMKTTSTAWDREDASFMFVLPVAL